MASKPAPSLYDFRDDVTSALILVDCQTDWFSASEEVRSAFPELPDNVAELLRTFRERSVPVVHVRAQYADPRRSVHMPFFSALNPEKPGVVSLEPEPWAPELPGELVVLKPTFDGFHDTRLHAELQARRVSRVYVCGLVTAACVLNTCFGAFRLGYEVVLVSDCTADRSREQHEAILSIYNGYTFVAASHAEVGSFLRGQRRAPAAPAEAARCPDDEVTSLYAECGRSSSGCASPAEGCAPAAGAPCPSLRLAPPLLCGAPHAPRVGYYGLGREASSSGSLASSFSSGSASSAGSEAAVPPSLLTRTPSVGGGLRAGLGGLALLARAVSIGLYCIAAGHGLDERLVLSPLRAASAAGGGFRSNAPDGAAPRFCSY